MLLDARSELRGRTALPAGRADTALRVAIAARRPVRRVVRVLRVVLALMSAAGFAGWALRRWSGSSGSLSATRSAGSSPAGFPPSPLR